MNVDSRCKNIYLNNLIHVMICTMLIMAFCLFACPVSSWAAGDGITSGNGSEGTQQETPAKKDEDFATPNFSELTVTKDYDYWDGYGIKLKWKSDCEYDKYYVNVYRSIGTNTAYQLISENRQVKTGNEFIYVMDSDIDIKAGVPYYYAVKLTSFVPGDSYMDEYYEYKTIVREGSVYEFPVYQEALEATEIKSVSSSYDNKSIEIKWSSSDGADGYRVYRSTTPGTGYTLIAEVPYDDDKYHYDSYYSNDYSYSDTTAVFGVIYYYVVCPYSAYNGMVFEGPYTGEMSGYINIAKTTITKASSPRKKTNVIQWKKVKEATGYKVYCSTTYGGKQKCLKTLYGNSKTKFTHKKVPHGKVYYYTVVAFADINGNRLENSSDPYFKCCNYYGCRYESYSERCQRIFGKNSYKEYKSAAEASKHMRTIRIKVWDISGGRKVTRTFPLTVNKKIAPTVQQMFNEIYRSKQKIPIHSIGAYSYRGGRTEHDEGLAIDINPNENYMIDNGKILSGSFWNPKKSPYSIPLKCDMVTIMEKYGFFRGFWGNRKDYMHFSYFGT